MLIEDVFIIENLQVLNEGKGGPMRVRGVFQRADEENNNKRIYPKALLEREIKKLDEAMRGRRLMGELDHPQHDSVKLSNVSHLITKLEAKGNEIIGEAEILDTPMGKVAKALIEGGVQVGISSRGMGTLSEGQDGKRYVNEDFRLITWDLVADPSTRGAFPSLAESRQSVLVEEIMNDVLPRVTKEKVFATLLTESLNEAKMKKAKKAPAKGGGKKFPDLSKDGKVTFKDILIGRGVIGKGERKDEMSPIQMQKRRTEQKRKMASQGPTGQMAYKAKHGISDSTLFARIGELLEGKKKTHGPVKQGDLRSSISRTAKMFASSMKNYGPTKRGDSGKISDSTLFPRVGAVLFEGLPAAKRVGELDAQGKPTGTSYVSGGRTGQMSGYGKKGGRLIGRDGKPHGFARQALGQYTQVDSRGKIPQPKKS